MSSRRSLNVAYLLSLLGFAGFAGIHRFYLGKYVSGAFYLITGGWFGIGTIYDLITMPRLVGQTNRLNYIEERMEDEDENADERHFSTPERPREAQSLEHLVFILAEENQGVLSTAQLALESGIQAEQAKEELDRLVDKGLAAHGQRRNGLNVYVFLEFLTPDMNSEVIF